MTLSLISCLDPVLRQKAAFINLKKPEFDVAATADEMLQVMARENGVGLAAPQVGLAKRLFVLAIDGQTLVCVNPKIIKLGPERVIAQEGCLSFPGIRIDVPRAKWINAAWLDLGGRWQKSILDGMWSRAFQHELDHLNGVVLTDYQKT